MKEDNKIFKTTLSFSLIGIMFVLIAIFFQLNQMNSASKINLTYKIYNDMAEWERSHPDARKWIYEYDDKDSVFLKDHFDKWQFDDYLTYYETIYSLEQKSVVDNSLVYDLYSANLEQIYEANNFELERLIKTMRIQQNDPEIYIGVEKLYFEFMERRKTISGIHKTAPTQK
jgi:hypothetical protein